MANAKKKKQSAAYWAATEQDLARDVCSVVATRALWRAGRLWPKGETKLTGADAEALGQAGFEALEADSNFTIAPIAIVPTGDKAGENT